MVNTLLYYFDLRYPELGNADVESLSQPTDFQLLAADIDKNTSNQISSNAVKISFFSRVIVQFISLVLGIVTQPFLISYQRSGSFWSNGNLSIHWLIFSVLVGMALFPLAYRRAMKSKDPDFVIICTIFSMGLGWQCLFSAIVKVI